jgi:hypothetical protein
VFPLLYLAENEQRKMELVVPMFQSGAHFISKATKQKKTYYFILCGMITQIYMILIWCLCQILLGGHNQEI